MKLFFINLSSCLLCLLPVALISGPLFSDLFVSLISIFFIILYFKEKLWKYYNNIFFKIFIVFYFYIFLGSFFTEKPSLSFESSLFYFRFGIFSVATWYLLEENKKLLKYFYKSMLITFIFLIFDSYVQFTFGKNMLGIEIPLNDTGQPMSTITGLFGNEQVLGSYLSKLFPFFSALIFLHLKDKYTLYQLLIFVSITVLIFLSGSRSSMAYHILSILFIVFFTYKRKFFFINLSIISLIIILAINFNNPQYVKRIKTSFVDIGISKLDDYDKSKNSQIKKNVKLYTSPRHGLEFGIGENKGIYWISPTYHSHLKTAYLMYKDSPIFGQGVKMFRYLCSDVKFKNFTDFGLHNYRNDYNNGCSTHPHNTHIQFLAETGIIGYFFLILALFYVLFCALRQSISILKKRELPFNNHQICLLGGFFIILWPLGSSGNFFNNWLSIIYYLPVGFYLYFSNFKKKT